MHSLSTSGDSSMAASTDRSASRSCGITASDDVVASGPPWVCSVRWF